MKLKVLSRDKEKTQEIALDLAKSLKKGRVIAFEGDLGTGKTTFIQGLAKGLGVKDRISSPTFTILKKYKVPKNKNIKWFYHFDLYRIENSVEILGLGFEEILEEKNTVIVIEWAEKIEKLLPKNILRIKIKYINKNSRELTFSDKTQV